MIEEQEVPKPTSPAQEIQEEKPIQVILNFEIEEVTVIAGDEAVYFAHHAENTMIPVTVAAMYMAHDLTHQVGYSDGIQIVIIGKGARHTAEIPRTSLLCIMLNDNPQMNHTFDLLNALTDHFIEPNQMVKETSSEVSN